MKLNTKQKTMHCKTYDKLSGWGGVRITDDDTNEEEEKSEQEVRDKAK